MENETFRGKSVIVTGASLGIGKEIALQLASQGAHLALAARNVQELERVVTKCQDQGGRALAVPTDVSDESQCQRLVQQTVAANGQIDAVINNAGIGMRARFDELPNLDLLKMVMNTNYWGCVYCTYHALPWLKKTKGRIVVVISGGGLFPTPGAIGYGASKHALVGLFNTLRIELQETGVTITTTYPEWVATGITTRAPLADGKPSGKLSAHEVGAMTAEECARQILYAAANRQRELLSTRLRIGQLVAPLFPARTDAMAVKAFK